jgi:hypothetical protein
MPLRTKPRLVVILLGQRAIRFGVSRCVGLPRRRVYHHTRQADRCRRTPAATCCRLSLSSPLLPLYTAASYRYRRQLCRCYHRYQLPLSTADRYRHQFLPAPNYCRLYLLNLLAYPPARFQANCCAARSANPDAAHLSACPLPSLIAVPLAQPTLLLAYPPVRFPASLLCRLLLAACLVPAASFIMRLPLLNLLAYLPARFQPNCCAARPANTAVGLPACFPASSLCCSVP